MTPKEKAKELIDTYLDIENKFNVDLFCDECGIERAAKYCALIAVDEIIKEINITSYLIKFQIDYGIYLYWEKVKEEIEKL